MKRILSALDTAFAYFTILPRRRAGPYPGPDAEALVALPLIGAVVGAISGTVAWLISRVAPRSYVVAAAFALPIILTGALHVDGFLDCCDAVCASASPSRRLEIMRDPQHGTYAIAAMTCVSVLWLSALSECRPARLPVLLSFSGALTRLAAVINALWLPYARPSSVTRAFEAQPSHVGLAAEALALIAFGYLIEPRVAATVPAACAAAAGIAHATAKRLGGGLTGDAYGFLIVTLEPGIVALAAAFDKR